MNSVEKDLKMTFGRHEVCLRNNEVFNKKTTKQPRNVMAAGLLTAFCGISVSH